MNTCLVGNLLLDERGEHNFDDLPPLCLWKVYNWRDILDARVIYQNIYLPFGGESIRHEPRNVITVCHICCLKTRPGQFRGGSTSSFSIDIRQRYPYTMLRKIAGDGQSNAGSRTCHDSDPAF